MTRTQTTTFRLRPTELKQLTDLAEEMSCSKTDVLRLGLQELASKDESWRRARKAESKAYAFIDRLKSEFGPLSRADFEFGADRSVRLRIDGEEPDGVRAEFRDFGKGVLGVDVIDATEDGDPDQIGVAGVQALPAESIDSGEITSISTPIGALYPRRGPDGEFTVQREGEDFPSASAQDRGNYRTEDDPDTGWVS